MNSVKEKLVGHYAHFDVVAYIDTTTQTTMKTFIVSYGFSDFYLENGKLYFQSKNIMIIYFRK